MSDTRKTIEALAINRLKELAGEIGKLEKTPAAPAAGQAEAETENVKTRTAITKLATSWTSSSKVETDVKQRWTDLADAESAVANLNAAATFFTSQEDVKSKCEEALRCLSCLKMSSQEVDLWKVAYTEAGNWARQYNTGRIAVAAIVIPTTATLMILSYGKPMWIGGGIAGIALWVLLGVVFAVMTKHYYDYLGKHSVDANSLGLPALFGSTRFDDKPKWKRDSGLIAVLICAVLGIAAGVGLCMFGRPVEPTLPNNKCASPCGGRVQ